MVCAADLPLRRNGNNALTISAAAGGITSASIACSIPHEIFKALASHDLVMTPCKTQLLFVTASRTTVEAESMTANVNCFFTDVPMRVFGEVVV